MDNTNTTLTVYFEYTPIGILKLDAKRKFEFQYLEPWLNHSESFPLSLTLPLRKEPYFDETVRPMRQESCPLRFLLSRFWEVRHYFLLCEHAPARNVG